MHQQYANEGVQFVGVFPNRSSTPENIASFKADYDLPFDLITDYDHIKTRAFGATVTPEVIVYHKAKKEILYQGRIDNTYARVGQKGA